MNPIQATLSAVLAASVAALAPPAASAQVFESGRTLRVSDYEIEFAKPATACLKLCTDIVVERQTFECVGFFVPPTEGCPLPWVDSQNPNPDPEGVCVPPEPEFGGHALNERVELVERRVRQTADCTSTVTETVLQQLPPTGNAPRPCPDPGPWSSTNETTRSIRFVACR